jgi:hypothetical protein
MGNSRTVQYGCEADGSCALLLRGEDCAHFLLAVQGEPLEG